MLIPTSYMWDSLSTPWYVFALLDCALLAGLAYLSWYAETREAVKMTSDYSKTAVKKSVLTTTRDQLEIAGDFAHARTVEMSVSSVQRLLTVEKRIADEARGKYESVD